MTQLTGTERYNAITRVNWICTALDTFLSIFKLTVGIFARSPGLIADGLHSLSDLATDVMALILGKLAQHGPDEDHPYGHARYETFGTAILGTALLVIAAGIAFENIIAIIYGESHKASYLALVAAGLSVVSKEALFHYTMKWARITRSNLLEANAWHSRSDSLSSIVVFIGIIFSILGYGLVEYIAAILVALLIGKMGFKLAWNAVQDLIDRGVSADQQKSYSETLESVTDILNAHNMRTRLMGSDVIVDAHIQVNPTISISEAHQINDIAVEKLKKAHPEINDVTLHIDFEKDDTEKLTTLSPKRQEIESMLEGMEITDYEKIYLHYSMNKVQIELMFSSRPEEARLAALEEITEKTDWIASISVYSK